MSAKPSSQQSIKIAKTKGRPWMHWIGKKGIDVIDPFPAQIVETFSASQEKSDSWKNLLLYGDNKEVMGSLMAEFRGEVDLIYIDPPFDSKADYIRKVELRGMKGTTMTGEEQSTLEQVQYADMWANDEYLQFMYERLILLRELLSETGSMYLHCDWHQSHRLRCLMDEVFGEGNFVNEIVWHYADNFQGNVKGFATNHNTLFWYSKSEKYTANKVMVDLGKTVKRDVRVWSKTKQKLVSDRDADGKIIYQDFTEKKADDVWEIGQSSTTKSASTEYLGYPTQKPEALLERIIKASSNPGDLVLDIFSGSGTTAAVAQKLGRRWIAADINHGAIQTTSKRLQKIMLEQLEKPKKILEEVPTPASLSFEIHRVNNYDLQIQHNEALQLALEKIGVEPLPSDRFFDGIAGNRLVKVIPLQRQCTIADLSAIEQELIEMRSEETRDIVVVCLGAETTVQPWIDEKNTLNKKSQLNQYRLHNLREGGFFEHRPVEARVSAKKKNDMIEVTIDDFHSPAIVERLGIENKKATIRASIPDFRSQIDCILIDLDYDGKIFSICHSDIPEKKHDLVEAKYSFKASDCGKLVAVKIIDMLGEEMIATCKL